MPLASVFGRQKAATAKDDNLAGGAGKVAWLVLPRPRLRRVLHGLPYLLALAALGPVLISSRWPWALSGLVLLLVVAWRDCPCPGGRRAADLPKAVASMGGGRWLLALPGGRILATSQIAPAVISPRWLVLVLEGGRYSYPVVALMPPEHEGWRRLRVRMGRERGAGGVPPSPSA